MLCLINAHTGTCHHIGSSWKTGSAATWVSLVTMSQRIFHQGCYVKFGPKNVLLGISINLKSVIRLGFSFLLETGILSCYYLCHGCHVSVFMYWVMCFCCIFDSLSCLSDKSVRSTSILDSKHILMFVHFSYPFQPHHQQKVGFQNSLTCLGGGMSLVTTVSANVLATA